MVLEQNVTVHIAAGTYRGGVVLADRSSRGNHRIRMLGEAGRTLVSGSNLQETGITIRRTSGVVLEGLAIQEFTRSGIGTHYAGPVSLISSRVSKNGEDGILSRLSDVIVRDSIIEGNGSAGVFCEQGWLSLGASASGRGVAILDNGGDGIRVTGCQARFEGPAIISGNRRGLVAEHGGEIALMLRSDVSILGNAVQGGSGGEPPPGGPVPPRPVPLAAQMQCQLVADCHGMISSYGNAAVGGGCACEAIGFGICRPD